MEFGIFFKNLKQILANNISRYKIITACTWDSARINYADFIYDF